MVASRSIARLAAQTVARRPIPSPSSASISFTIAAARCQRRQISTNLLAASRAQIFPVTNRKTTSATIRTSRRAYSQDPATAGESKFWDFDQVKALISSGEKPKVILVDAREPQELADEGKIPGAINIPIKSAPDSFHITEDEFEDRFGYPRPPKDAEVVFYCKAGVRSRAAAQLARSAGWNNTSEYPGSWLDWVANGGKIAR